jgi:hypothetical protein
LWLFRETLAKAGLVEKLFERFGQHLEAKGYIARGGQMVDATRRTGLAGFTVRTNAGDCCGSVESLDVCTTNAYSTVSCCLCFP